MLLEQRPIRLGTPGQRKFELRVRALRQRNKLQKLVVLAPRVGLAVELHLAPELPPAPDGGEQLARRGSIRLPLVHDDWLTRGHEPKASGHRNQTIRPAVVLA